MSPQSRYYNPAIRQFISPDAFVSTGQGYMGYNMFAYCGNNPVKYSDPAGTMMVIDKRGLGGGGITPQAAPQLSYINSQYNDEIENKRFGLATVGHGGCGAVATYNALIDLGNGRSFDSVLAYFNRNIFNRVYWFGFAGTRVKHIKGFFESEGFKVTLTSDYDKINALSKIADGCILYYEWTYDSVWPFYKAHFVSYNRSDSGYRYYNVERFSGQPSAFLSREKATKATGIFIFK